MENSNIVVKPGIYRHFKGGMYRVLYMAKHSEDLSPMVVYQSLKDGSFWVRPASMWNETVERDGQSYLRFQYVGEDISEK